jgi:hypothetical protein
VLVHNTRARHYYISTLTLWLVTALCLLLFAAVYSGVFNSAPVATSENHYQTFYSPHYGYSIDYPATWQVVDQTGLGVFSATSKPQPKSDQGGTNFSQRALLNSDEIFPAAGFSKIDVVADELEGPMSAQDYMLAKVGPMPQGKISILTIGGQDAIRIDVQSAAALANHTDTTVYSNFYVTNGKYGYIVAGFAAPVVLNHIISSLAFDK